MALEKSLQFRLKAVKIGAHSNRTLKQFLEMVQYFEWQKQVINFRKPGWKASYGATIRRQLESNF